MLSRIKAILKQSGYVLNTKPYQLNIVGLRNKSTNSNRFDDEIHVFFTKPDSKWDYHIYPATTDPGTFWLNNPSFEQGTAILAQGQYRNAYAIGKHKGLYTALVQILPVTVIRDYDRDAVLDFYNGTKQIGNFGINIHRAESFGETKFINKYSAGCQVFQNAADFDKFIALCEQHKKLYGNKFTYTLIDLRALNRITLKRVVTATTIAAGLILGILLTTND
jgi:hypothetical protein